MKKGAKLSTKSFMMAGQRQYRIKVAIFIFIFLAFFCARFKTQVFILFYYFIFFWQVKKKKKTWVLNLAQEKAKKSCVCESCVFTTSSSSSFHRCCSISIEKQRCYLFNESWFFGIVNWVDSAEFWFPFLYVIWFLALGEHFM